MASLKLYTLLLLGLILTSCASDIEYQIKKPNVVLDQKLNKVLKLSSGLTLDLQNYTTRPLILVFASEYCFSCDEELKKFQNYLGGSHITPQNVDIISILIRADESISQEWKNKKSIAWSVAYDDDNLELFKAFCPIMSTPCIVVNHPNQGIVMTAQRVVPLSEIIYYTGEWL